MILLLFLLTLSSVQSFGEESSNSEYRVQYEQSLQRVTFDLYEENSIFVRDGKNLNGFGVGVLVNYAIGPSFSLGGGISQALTTSYGTSVISALFTAFRTTASYVLTGQFLTKNESLLINGETVFSQQEHNQFTLALEIGIEEFLFNGTSQVLPGSGITLGSSFRFPIGSQQFKFEVRSGILSQSGMTTIPIIVDFGISLKM